MDTSSAELVRSLRRRALGYGIVVALVLAVVIVGGYLLSRSSDGLGWVELVLPVVVILVMLGIGRVLIGRMSRGLGLAPPRSKLGRLQRDPAAATWGPGVYVDPASEIRVRAESMGPPSAGSAIAATYGGGPAPTTTSRETGATYIFDPTGLRLSWPGGLNFAVRWDELARVSLQIQHGQHVVMTRLVLWASHPESFAAAHPEIEFLHGVGGLGPAAWAASLGVDGEPDPDVLRAARAGLRYAGGRFSGQVEQVGTQSR